MRAASIFHRHHGLIKDPNYDIAHPLVKKKRRHAAGTSKQAKVIFRKNLNKMLN